MLTLHVEILNDNSFEFSQYYNYYFYVKIIRLKN